jgi:hypothetical protein
MPAALSQVRLLQFYAEHGAASLADDVSRISPATTLSCHLRHSTQYVHPFRCI